MTHDISACIKAEEELQALREWKAKAMPVLEDLKFNISCQLTHSKTLSGELRADKEESYNELTELLGGDDDTR